MHIPFFMQRKALLQKGDHMKKENVPSAEARGILYAVMVMLTFLAAMALILGGVYLYNRNKDFYSALQGELNRGFYLTALLVLLGTSVVYTPFSYGISHYFLLSAEGNARFSALFFLFCRPLLLVKAVGVSMVKKVLIYLERLGILLGAALVEVVLFFCFLVVMGENIFAVKGDPFSAAAEFMLRNPALIALSVLLWCGVLLMLFFSYLRYILCKYVLMEYPDVSVFQAVGVGKNALRGNFRATLLFYLRYGASTVLYLLSFGRYRRRLGGFSLYARSLARDGWRNYCRKRSRGM